MHTSELPEFDFMSAQNVDDVHKAMDWSRYPDGLARSTRGLEILSYDLVGRAYRSTVLRNSTAAKMSAIGFSDGPVFAALTGMTTSTEGAEHRRMRRAFQPWFVADHVERLRTAVRAHIDNWVERNSSGVVDFAGELGASLPATVFTQLVGAEPDEAAFVSHASSEILKFAAFNPDVHDSVEAGVLAVLTWQEELIARKLNSPGPDLTSALLQAERDGAIRRDHTHRILVTLIVASTESTRAQMSCNLVALATHESQWHALREHPQALRTAVQELYRYAPATLSTSRSPETDTVFASVPLRANEPVFLNRITSNNDPAAYDRPRELDVLRVRDRAPFTFGNGRHSCVGQMIAAIEQEELIASLIAHWENFEVAESAWTGFPFTQSPVTLKFSVSAR